MDLPQLVDMLSGRPESFGILAILVIFGWKYFPVLKKKVEMQQSQLEMQRAQSEGDMRRERILQDIASTLAVLNKTVATKSDIIDLMSQKSTENKALNSSGSIVKQGI